MKSIVNTNTTTKALTISKLNNLAVINKASFNIIRISSKSIFAAFVLTLLNMII